MHPPGQLMVLSKDELEKLSNGQKYNMMSVISEVTYQGKKSGNAPSRSTMVLSKDELEKPCSADKILVRAQTWHRRFKTKELRAAAREGKYSAKELTEEAYPIALFAHCYYQASPKVTITHLIGNQPYDATVADNRKKPAPIRFIEVTVSDKDYEDSLRMELLNRDGRVPLYGGVKVKGPKGRRTKLEPTGEFCLDIADVDKIREDHIDKVTKAVEKKAGNQYQPDTALVVRVADIMPSRNEDAKYIAALNAVAKNRLVPLLSNREFRVLAFVGPREHQCLCYDL